HTSRPTTAQLNDISDNYPTEPTTEGYTFTQNVGIDTQRQTEMGSNPSVTIPYGPFGGLIANLSPYTINSVAKSASAECSLTRNMNNYLIPLFQFGMFSDED